MLCCRPCQLLSEGYRISHRATAQVPCQDQLCMALNADKRPGIAYTIASNALMLLRPFLHPDESPKLIALDFFNRYAFDAFRHHVFTLLANGNQQLQNGVTMNASNSLGAANRATLNQMLQHA